MDLLDPITIRRSAVEPGSACPAAAPQVHHLLTLLDKFPQAANRSLIGCACRSLIDPSLKPPLYEQVHDAPLKFPEQPPRASSPYPLPNHSPRQSPRSSTARAERGPRRSERKRRTLEVQQSAATTIKRSQHLTGTSTYPNDVTTSGNDDQAAPTTTTGTRGSQPQASTPNDTVAARAVRPVETINQTTNLPPTNQTHRPTEPTDQPPTRQPVLGLCHGRAARVTCTQVLPCPAAPVLSFVPHNSFPHSFLPQSLPRYARQAT